MSGSPAGRTVLVTGGSGFVAAHLVRQLLERGYRVHTTVRATANAAKRRPLRALGDAHPGRLELFEADLLTEGSFDEAMKGCTVVFHVASPFLMPERIKDGRRDVVEPALTGTRNVVASIERTETVERLVLTSTVGAIFGDYADVRQMDDQTLSEKYFNTTSTVENNPYHYAKTVAERAAWEAEAAQSRWRMVSVNPGLILGPSLTPARTRAACSSWTSSSRATSSTAPRTSVSPRPTYAMSRRPTSRRPNTPRRTAATSSRRRR